ncbi:ABC transporter ATP-binding protein [Salinibacterium sp. NSLL150]|uniref:dipeptide ABC transporter ATP-binding protein n=1 Tax=unclassified Salinibacterium TaxID=2632331 RepID=UPI0018CE7489|nr:MULTISPECIES: ABC transporter ATP-binding protein [unclassified Salinibacterium]MBH0099673.1 ABC transporter ATP-binding protein [Salinibacterium sp. NSLL35]MBH0102427.1 ABC transporter ATP-binding protein [Salinibacterium sp. NSLL150]MBH0105187.1 ABC transporter ATP-binding protein [Salinibacterium sp. NSLL16]MBH0107947.1 ABC transporter ATP-binding protein [Salinibacterium sp. NSLL17]
MTTTDSPIEPTLSVRNLTVNSAFAELLHGISFDIAPGERVGLIGESGSGKSLTATSVMGLLPDTLAANGEIHLAGGHGDLVHASESTLSQLRGNTMAMVFQEPMTALNPLMKAGAQVAEIMTQHGTVPAGQSAAARAVELLAQVKLPNPAEAALAFPHQLSGGQRQRVMLAMAMANDPQLLLCDEPTTALDVTVQAEVLRLIEGLVTERGTSLLFITHDIGVVAEVCERVLVMYKGDIVEDGTVEQVITNPQHPYTKALIAASNLSVVDERGRLHTIATSAITLPTAAELAAALEEPAAPTAPVEPTIATPASASTLDFVIPHQRRTDPDERIIFNEIEGEPLIRVRDLTRQYKRRGGGKLFGKPPVVHGLRGLDFDVAKGQRFGIVGESGSGKSTLMRLMCALDEPTGGSITVSGQELAGAKERELRDFRSQVQIVFQDPMGSLDPRMKVEQIVAEPLRGVSRDESRERVIAQLESVGLEADVMHRHPHQFSGGQRQRISIARALITRPRVLVADEAVSALDVSVRAQVLNLLSDLVDEYALTLLFVSHDLGVIRHACDTVAVLSDGRIVECGPTDDVYDNPLHPYTQKLVSATPSISELAGRARS